MAKGTFTLFEEFTKELGDKSHDFANDSFSIIFISEGALSAAQVSPDRADFTEVTAGGGYIAGGRLLTAVTWTEVNGVSTFNADNLVWSSNGTGDPTNIKTGLLVNNSHTGTNDAVGFIDITADNGVTAASLLVGDITLTLNVNGLFTITNV